SKSLAFAGNLDAGSRNTLPIAATASFDLETQSSEYICISIALARARSLHEGKPSRNTKGFSDKSSWHATILKIHCSIRCALPQQDASEPRPRRIRKRRGDPW